MKAAWLVLVGLFAAAVVYVVVAVPGSEAPARDPAPALLAHSDGLTDNHGGYRLEAVTLPAERGEAVPLAFRILGPDGKPAEGYAPTQTKPLHLYVVREDLSGYQHLHPTLDGDTWRVPVRVTDGGVYRIYTEFTPPELASLAHPVVLGTRFIVTGDTAPVPLPKPEATVKVDGLTVKRLDGTRTLISGAATTLQFEVVGATLEPYLGAYAHMSAFDALTQALTHLHPAAASAPAASTLTFHTAFHHRGVQRLFLQFQTGGTVHLAAFTIAVS